MECGWEQGGNRHATFYRSRAAADDARLPLAAEGGNVFRRVASVPGAAGLAAAVGGRHGARVAHGEARQGAQEGGQFQASGSGGAGKMFVDIRYECYLFDTGGAWRGLASGQRRERGRRRKTREAKIPLCLFHMFNYDENFLERSNQLQLISHIFIGRKI